jgi:hypothetical protein
MMINQVRFMLWHHRGAEGHILLTYFNFFPVEFARLSPPFKWGNMTGAKRLEIFLRFIFYFSKRHSSDPHFVHSIFFEMSRIASNANSQFGFAATDHLSQFEYT